MALSIIIDNRQSLDEDAKMKVKNTIAHGSWNQPLIPAVDEAQIPNSCYDCGNSIWVSLKNDGNVLCDDCKEDEKKRRTDMLEALADKLIS